METSTHMGANVVTRLQKKAEMFQERWLMSLKKKDVLSTRGGVSTLAPW